MMPRLCVGAALLLAALAAPVPAAMTDVPHPFILWTRDDAAALRKTVETQDWAKAAYETLRATPDNERGSEVRKLFRYAVMGEKDLAAELKKELLRMVRSRFPQGAAQWVNVLRYDVLYDELSADERRECEACFRTYIERIVFERAIFDPKVFNNSRNYARYDAREYTRANWLPNIAWPWKVSANLMALALKDEALIRKTWAPYGSWQWYFDAYLCDTGFYAEEFSKMGATPGAMLVYCLGLERLGLGELGFGYRGKGGATMRGHIESLLHLGYPRVDVGTGRPHYPMVTIGDLRQSGSSQDQRFGGEAFQHSLVRGTLRDGSGGNERWKVHGAWGGTVRGNHAQWDGYSRFTPKMQMPLWFEIGHARWPDAGFDYFLAQMRGPGEDAYVPSLYFGLGPIDPATAKPPPAPSAVWPERGLVMLRAEASPAFWESGAPAVCLRLATNYAHNVNDAFALAGYYAFNRPIYLNRQIARSYAQGWSRSTLSHCATMVDLAEPKFTDATQVRRAFGRDVKFVAARSREVYPGTDLTRALLLTRDYLLDVTRLVSDQPRTYHWLVHTLGEAVPDPSRAWAGSAELAAALYARVGDRGGIPVRDERRLDAGAEPWSLTALQTCAVGNPTQSRVGAAWWAARIGVRITMLGEAGTVAYTHRTPEQEPRPTRGDRPPAPPEPNEFGGLTVVVSRKAPSTVFAALHEPFKGAAIRVADFRRVAQTGDALAVAVVGKPGTGIDDRAMIRFGDDVAKPVTLAGGGEEFTFADRAYVRITKERVEASGDLRAMKLKVGDVRPTFVLNGRECPAEVADGYLVFGR